MPTLRRELLAALVVVFAGAMAVATVGIVLLLPQFEQPSEAALYVGLLMGADIAVFAIFGHIVVRRRVLDPLQQVVAEVEAIAEGDYERRIGGSDSEEVSRLAEAVNEMASRLIAHQRELAANIQSLQETNRELTEARDELVRAEKMASVGRLAAGVAHEIGNPLGAIIGYLGVLGRGLAPDRRELVDAAQAETRRIDRIVHGLLDYARPREARARTVEVNDVVERTVELLTVQGKLSRVAVRTALAPDAMSVRADWNQLQQVLVNLMINALDAMEAVQSPMLELSTDMVTHRPRRRLPARRRGDPPDIDYSHRRRFHSAPGLPRERAFPVASRVVRIVVADNGEGIPAEHRAHVFEPFFTTKEPGKGTGLGLAVAARLVDAMGGTIEVESNGSGTRFSVLLPGDSQQAEGADS
jgi:two-component system, NtrC family, sensor kinase